MKKLPLIITAFIALIFAQSCGNTKLSSAEEREQHTLNDSLKAALANADTMYALLYDVTVGLDQIARLEHLLQSDINGESPEMRADISRQMAAIQRGLRERRERIEHLEQQLHNNSNANSRLQARINDLRAQIDNQAQTVREMNARLEAANIKIEELQDSITGLTASVDSINQTHAGVEQNLTDELNKAYEELNTVYFVIGNADELKDHGFKKGGNIFRKSRLGDDFDISYMTRADRRTLTSIPLDSKKVKVISEQPEDSYSLEKDADGFFTLVITNPDAFWAMRDFLVIEVK